MLRKVVTVLVALTIVSASGFVSWRMTALDRVVERAEHGLFASPKKLADLKIVAAHPNDPRSRRVVKAYFKDVSSSCSTDYKLESYVDVMNAVFTAQPLDGSDESADLVVAMVGRCSEPRAKTWGSVDDKTLVRAVHKLLYESSAYVNDAKRSSRGSRSAACRWMRS